jgi:hypothetical protein
MSPRSCAGRAASAEAGREFDKLATDLTTPRDSLTREVNLVVSLSRTPPLITSPSRSHLLRSYDRFSLFVYRFSERGAEAFNQPLLTKPSITRNPGSRQCTPSFQLVRLHGPPPNATGGGPSSCREMYE